MIHGLIAVASIVLAADDDPASLVMSRYFRRPFDALRIASALLGICMLASLFRPGPSLAAAPPAKAMARWMWFDRAVRFERWHPPFAVSGTYAFSSSSPDAGIFTARRGVTYDVTSQPDGTLAVRTFDFWQFNVWAAAGLVMPLTAVFAIASWWYRRNSPARVGICITCGYDLRASADRCPECGTPIASEVGPGHPVPGGRER
jgi:hypothetical protein